MKKKSASQPRIVQDMIAHGRARSSREFAAAGVSRSCLAREVEKGTLLQYQRGVYCSPDIPDGMIYAAAALTLPGGVVCLQSAAAIHGIPDEAPASLWYAIDGCTTKSTAEGGTRDPITRLHWSGPALTVGVDVMTFAGVPVNVTGPARTVVDMIRRSPKTGEQSARALRDFMLRGGDPGEVREIARALGCERQVAPLLRAAKMRSPAKTT